MYWNTLSRKSPDAGQKILALIHVKTEFQYSYSGLRPSKAVRCHVKNTSKFDPWLICFINGDASNELLLGPAALEGHSAKRFLIENFLKIRPNLRIRMGIIMGFTLLDNLGWFPMGLHFFMGCESFPPIFYGVQSFFSKIFY